MARLAWAAFTASLLAYAAGCTRRAVDYGDGGAPDLAAVDLAGGNCGQRSIASCAADPRCKILDGCCGGPQSCVTLDTQVRCAPCPPACDTLDERSCLVDSRCRADYCQACACVPSFVECRAKTAPRQPCPLYDCPQPLCECDGLDERSCKAAAPTRGCTAQYCPDCNGGQWFSGCLGPNAGTGACPAFCPQTCHTQNECGGGLGQTCLAPDESAGCGACFDPGTRCGGDDECADGEICDAAPCSCVSALSCIPGCQTTSDCPDGQLCGADHRCQPRKCDSAPCPTHFVCVAASSGSFCQRKSCTSDINCSGGFCVKQQCHSRLGICSSLPP